jgi:hypothetical protein
MFFSKFCLFIVSFSSNNNFIIDLFLSSSFFYLLSFLYLIVLSLPQSTKFYYFFSHVYVSCLFFLFHFPKIFIIYIYLFTFFFLRNNFGLIFSMFLSFLLRFPFPPFASPNSPQTSLAILFFPLLFVMFPQTFPECQLPFRRFVPHLATFSPVDI